MKRATTPVSTEGVVLGPLQVRAEALLDALRAKRATRGNVEAALQAYVDDVLLALSLELCADCQRFGCERVFELLRAHHRRPCDELIQVLHQAVRSFGAGVPQNDDLTAVAIKRLGA